MIRFSFTVSTMLVLMCSAVPAWASRKKPWREKTYMPECTQVRKKFLRNKMWIFWEFHFIILYLLGQKQTELLPPWPQVQQDGLQTQHQPQLLHLEFAGRQLKDC